MVSSRFENRDVFFRCGVEDLNSFPLALENNEKGIYHRGKNKEELL